jgi:hypothetical protein
MDDEDAIPLTDGDLVRLSLTQLDSIVGGVEEHASEMGMLLEGLLSLIERHADEARSTGSEDVGALAARTAAPQLECDHETMLEFGVPLVVASQFYDRLRQRLEHLRSAIGRLPATPALRDAHRAAAAELFPFDEELAATSPMRDASDESDASETGSDPRVELF